MTPTPLILPIIVNLAPPTPLQAGEVVCGWLLIGTIGFGTTDIGREDGTTGVRTDRMLGWTNIGTDGRWDSKIMFVDIIRS